ncbi:MAG TPA: thioredoxin-dependent thiol peroxidase [Pirellulaceae bacterium]|nr:thioredoxin-dependent thiol peroxidase [Pirellulaceae bacterium]
MADWLQPGEKSPDFTLSDQHGKPVTLSKFRGRPVVVYFYPRDNTPGCTHEACSFRDAHASFAEYDVQVLGISTDGQESHQTFAHKHQLNYPILSDPDHKVAEAYGAWRERKQWGKIFWATQRSTFLIDPDGRIVKVWKKVSVATHVQEVLTALDEFMGDESQQNR